MISQKISLEQSYNIQGKYGQVYDYADFINVAKTKDIKVVVAADILSLVTLTSPGEMGADVVVGTTQRFGIPLGYGGPHAGFFTTKEEYKRSILKVVLSVFLKMLMATELCVWLYKHVNNTSNVKKRHLTFVLHKYY